MLGLFDSGVGGLTVTKAILGQHPDISLLYFGDVARAPYGVRSPQEVQQYAVQATEFLLQEGATQIVIACHTAASVATELLRATFPTIPIVSIVEHGLEEALRSSATGRIAVLSTNTTAQSGVHVKNLRALDPFCVPFSVGLSELVPRIESGARDRMEILRILQYVFLDLMREQIDTVVLACTHFPLIVDSIRSVFGTHITIIDPADALSRALHPCADVLPIPPIRKFFFSRPPQATQMAEALLGESFVSTVISPL